MEKKVALITGITGQDGAYLSDFLLKKNYKIIGFVRPKDDYSKLEYLGIKNKIEFIQIDLLDFSAVKKEIDVIRPDEIYNFAAQSSVGLSSIEPYQTIQFNIISTLNLLEAIKHCCTKTRLFHPSSSEMFGEVENLPVNEKTPFLPLNPYAASKVSAHWIVVNYRKLFNIFACCGIMFNHESYLRGNNFFVKKIIRHAIEIKSGKRDSLIVGNLHTKRDMGFAPEYIKAMWLMLQKEKAGDYVVSSGKSISLESILYYVFDKLEVGRDKIVVDKKLFRPFEVEECYGDNSKAKKELNWKYDLSFYQVLDLLIKEEKENSGVFK